MRTRSEVWAEGTLKLLQTRRRRECRAGAGSGVEQHKTSRLAVPRAERYCTGAAFCTPQPTRTGTQPVLLCLHFHQQVTKHNSSRHTCHENAPSENRLTCKLPVRSQISKGKLKGVFSACSERCWLHTEHSAQSPRPPKSSGTSGDVAEQEKPAQKQFIINARIFLLNSSDYFTRKRSRYWRKGFNQINSQSLSK